jgi:peptidoglycan hydrolase-like protein with peptidoglycan-binding domain
VLRQETRQAIERFQSRQGLPVTGNADDATREKLVEINGS